jgi:hypothetical protein
MKNYRYAFDRDGYYLGLCRPIETNKTTELPVYPEYSTDVEPYWKDGFVSKYDFTLNRYLKEKELLKYPDIYNEQGEWILRTNAKETFEKLITNV